MHVEVGQMEDSESIEDAGQIGDGDVTVAESDSGHVAIVGQ